MVEEQKGYLGRGKEQRKEERTMSSKVELSLRGEMGKAKCWGCNTHSKKPVSIFCVMGTRGVGSRKLTWLESGSRRSSLQPPVP